MRSGESGTFSQARGLIQRSNRLLVVVLLGAFIVATGVWFVFVSGFFSLSRIEMNELHALGREEVASSTLDILEQGRWRPWDRKNLIFIDENDLAESLKNRLFAEQVSVDKSYPNILRLLIEERQRSVVMASKDQLLVVDMAGGVVGEAGETAAKEARDAVNGDLLADLRRTPVIVCDLPELATAGYQVTDQDALKAWIEAYRAFIASGLKFRYLRLTEPKSKIVKLMMAEGYHVVFDLDQDIQGQIETYRKFMQNRPRDFKVSEYVDVRVPGKIYVK